MSDDRADLPAIEALIEVAGAGGILKGRDVVEFGAYEVPDPARRRRAGVVYFVGAGIVVALMVAGLPTGMWVMATILLAIGAYHFAAGGHLRLGDAAALAVADDAIDFPIGHASAVLGFDGILAGPVWNVLVFSAEEPPARRGIVRVDGRSGEVVETYVEELDSP